MMDFVVFFLVLDYDKMLWFLIFKIYFKFVLNFKFILNLLNLGLEPEIFFKKN